MKSDIIDKVAVFLLKQGFTVKTLTGSCFDLLARSSERILIIKVLEDANSITRQYVDEMESVASYLSATPLMIAEKAGTVLEENVLYTRFGMYTLNFRTFTNSIKNKFPFIQRTQAGLTAYIDGNRLKKKREEEGYSVNSLSKKIGVTSRMISRYENEDSEITINRAMKLYNVFGDEVFNQINIFSKNISVEPGYRSSFSKKYTELGFEATDTRKSPFDIIARKDDELILTEVGDKTSPDFTSLSRLLDADSLVIFDKKKPKDLPSIKKKEFLEFHKANELIRFLKEF